MSPTHSPLVPRSVRLVAAGFLAVGLVAATGVAPVTGASAHTDHTKVAASGSTTDPDDTAGRLDIAAVRDVTSQVDRHHFVVSYRVRLQNEFASSRFDADDRNLVIELNRDSEAGSERNVRVSARSGVLVAEVISNATREVIATVDVTRPSDRSVRISGPRRLLGARSYFWTSNFHAPRSSRCGVGDGFPIVCQDSVPQRGWLRLQRPAWPARS